MAELNQEMKQDLTPQQQLEDLLKYTEDLMAEEQYDKAQDVLNNALTLDTFDLKVYKLYSFVLRMNGNAQGAEIFEKVVMNPGDPSAFYTVATTLLREKAFGPALSPLKKVLELVPMAGNVHFDLGYTYLKMFDLEQALEHFKISHEYQPSMQTGFYVGYTSLLQRDTETAKSYVPYLEAEAAKTGERSAMLDTLIDMIARYEAFPPTNLRDWHFVQYGMPLLRLSDEDIKDPSSPLNGRYVFINYGWGNMAYGMYIFKRLVEELEIMPKYEFVIPAGPKGSPAAFALSQMLDVPLVTPEALKSGQPGIVFAAWTDEVDRVAQHLIQNPQVTLFAFSLGYTLQAGLVPDFVGYLDQSSRLPWQSTVMVTKEGERKERPAMTAPPEVVGHYILDRIEKLTDEEKAELEQIVDYYKERQHLLKVGEQRTPYRLGFNVESPIISPRMIV
ncbi:MAG TPA: hypothetical protein VFV52_13940 [Bacilli bacterium]|nr:hypothetical protein [Bacilli bacterium]